MAESDWDTVTYLRKNVKAKEAKKPQAKDKSKTKSTLVQLSCSELREGSLSTVLKAYMQTDKIQAINAARRKGEPLETSMKYNAGHNKQQTAAKNTSKLDRETEELHHDRVSMDVGKLIQKGRQDKGMTQKDLATKINEKPQVINDYEAGRAIPNNQIMSKIERAIGLKLRGKDKGQPLTFGKKK